MQKIDTQKYSNPRFVNQQGGILLDHESGTPHYLDAGHPQYDDIVNGLVGVVESAIIEDTESADHETMETSEIENILADLVESLSVPQESERIKKLMRVTKRKVTPRPL